MSDDPITPVLDAVEGVNIAYVEGSGPFTNFSSMTGQLYRLLAKRQMPYKAGWFAIIYDTPENFDCKQLYFAAAVEILGKFIGNGEPASIPRSSGLMAKATYRGPFDGLGGVYQNLITWAQAQGYKPMRPCYVYFLSGPMPGEPGSGETVMEIQLPLM